LPLAFIPNKITQITKITQMVSVIDVAIIDGDVLEIE
jgi:hypothetical protein